MSRGKPALPTAEKVIRGTFRKDRAKNEPKPKLKSPSCPTWLGQEAKREWRRIAPRLLKRSVLTEWDRSALAAYCDAYQDWYEARKDLDAYKKKHGSVLMRVGEHGYLQQHPSIAIKTKAKNEMKGYLALFGLSPADRGKLDIKKEEEDDGFDDYFK